MAGQFPIQTVGRGRDIRTVNAAQFLRDRYDGEIARREWRSRWWHRPDIFMREAFDWPAEEEPHGYQLDAGRNLVEKIRESVRSGHGSGKCVVVGERIDLYDGRQVPVEDLIGRWFVVPSIRPDFSIVPAVASATWNSVDSTVEIQTDYGRRLARTVNHPLWAASRTAKVSGRHPRILHQGWVEAGALKPGDLVAVPELVPVTGAQTLPESEVKLLAYLIGDGGLTTTSVKFSQAPGPMLDEVRACAAEYDCVLTKAGPYDYAITTRELAGRKIGGHAEVRNPIHTMLRRHGLWKKGSGEKRFPPAIWELPREQLAIFLSRLYATDGWAFAGKTGRGNRSWRNEIGYCTLSQGLAEDVQRALLRFGIVSKIRSRQPKNGRLAWMVEIFSADMTQRFAERIGIYGKQDRVQALSARAATMCQAKVPKWRHLDLPPGFRWERVRTVTPLGPQRTVAITVPETGTFLTHFVEHNTAFAAQIVLWFRVTRDDHPGGGDWKVVTTASAWRQLEHYLWPEIHKWVRRLKPELRQPVERGLLTMALKGRTGEAFAVASDEPALIEGAHAKHLLYVFDEAKAIPDETYNAAEGAFTGGGKGSEVYFLMISTPGAPSGRFYDIQTRRKGFEDWHPVHWSSGLLIEAGRMTEVWREQRKRQWGETSAVFQNRVEGNFAAQDEEAVIPLAWAEAAIDRWRALKAEGKLPTDRTHYGLDVGRGGDLTIMAERAGNVIVGLQTNNRADTMAAAGLIVQALRAHPEAQRAMVDVIGIGAGPYDRAREQVGDRVAGFNGAAHAKDPMTGKDLRDSAGIGTFQNMRAAAWWGLRERLDPSTNPELALPDDDDLLGDLVAPKWELTSAGRIKIEEKEDIIERIGRSPDRGDAVVYAFADKLMAPARHPMVFF